MSYLKPGESLERYGRNKGGRYAHIIRGGKFVEGAENFGLCWADITKPATEKDRRRGCEICWKCEDREKTAEPNLSEPHEGGALRDAVVVIEGDEAPIVLKRPEELGIPEELRATATQLRCEHSFPVQPPHGSLFAPGPCSRCGVAWAACARDIPDRLREPLAALLDEAANEVETVLAEEVTLGPDDTYDKAVLDHQGEIRADLTHALAVARAVTGGDRG
ncbi:hypothetical protein ABT352_32750 [Streptosporangium sp. NPDC000563]|uniref:hypothetical protein n=1 Tax=Streptosporangium sp. NPDC000563 TaxID=3154366 RepID=UPI0033325CDF